MNQQSLLIKNNGVVRNSESITAKFSGMKKIVQKSGAFPIILLLLHLLALNAATSFAQTRTSTTNGNWSAAATWVNTNITRTGNVSSSTASTTVTGAGTSFLTDLSVGSVITTTGGAAIGTVLSIASNSSLTLNANASTTQTNQPYRTTSGPPSPIDAVIIASGNTVTVNGTFACTSLLLNSGGNATAFLAFAAGSPTLTVSGAVTVGNSGNANMEGEITFTNGSTLIAGSLSLGAVGSQSSVITMTAGGTLRVNGSLTSFSGTTWTSGTGTLELTTTNTLPSSIFNTFNNLTISGGTTTAGAGFSVAGILNIASGATLNMGTLAMTGASLTTSGTGTLQTQATTATPLPTGRTWSGTVQYNRTTGGQTIMAGTYNVLTLGNTSGTETASGAITATTLNTTTGGIFDMVTNALTVTNVSHAGTLNTQNTSATPLSVGKTWGGTVNYNNGLQTVVGGTYNNLGLSGANKTFGAAVTVSNALAIGFGITANLGTFASTANTLSLNSVGQPSGLFGGTGSGATYINSSFFAANTGTINVASSTCTAGTWLGIDANWFNTANWCGGTLPGSGTNVTISSGVTQPVIGAPGGALCSNIIISSGANLTISGSNDLTVSGNFSNNGTFTGNSSTLNIAGNYTNTGTFTAGTSSVVFTATSGTQTLSTTGGNFFNVSHTGAGTLQLSSILNTTGAFSNSAGIFNANGLTNTVTGIATISGGTYIAGTTTQNFNGGLTINGGIFTGSGGIVNVTNLILSSGTLTAPSAAFNVTGDWTRNGGTFTAGSNTVTFAGTANPQTIGGTASTAFNVLAISKTAITNILDVTGVITTSSLLCTAGTLRISSASNITVAPGTTTIPAGCGLTINNAGAVVNNSGGSLTMNGSLIVLNGDLNVGNGQSTLTISSIGTFSGGTVDILGRLLLSGGTTIMNGSVITLNPQATNNLASTSNIFDVTSGANITFSSGSVTIINPHQGIGSGNAINIVAGGTKNFAGSTISLGNGTASTSGTTDGFDINSNVALDNLIIDNPSGTGRDARLITSSLVLNNLTVTAGILNANALNISLAGAWNKNGTFTASTGTVTFNGTALQTISGTATTFNNLTFNNVGGSISMATSASVSNTLTLTSGVVATGLTNILTVSATGASVSGGGAASYINGNLRRAVASGGSTVVFAIGDASNFTPASLVFAGVTGAGSVTLSATAGLAAVPGNATLGLSTANGINRYWGAVNNTITGGSYAGTYTYVNGSPVDNLGTFTTSALRTGIYNGSTWSYPGQVTASTATTVTMPSTSNFGTVVFAAQRPVTASIAGSATKPYDGNTTAPLGSITYSLAGVVSPDVVTVAGSSAAYNNKNVAGSPTKQITVSSLSLGGANADNYSLSSTTANANIGTITAISLTASIAGSATKPYDGNTTAPLGSITYSLSGVISPDVVSVSGTSGAYNNKDVAGSPTKQVTVSGLSLSGADAGNYSLSSTTANANIGTITAISLTASIAGSSTKPYDGNTTAPLGSITYSLAGVISPDVVSVSGTSGAYNNKDVAGSPTKQVTVSGLSLGGANAGNYSLSSTTANANIGTITAATLTVSATGNNKPYDGNTTATVSLSDNRAGGDALTTNYSAANFVTAAAGSNITINVTGITVTGADAGNYTFNTTATTSADITPVGQSNANFRSRQNGVSSSVSTWEYDGGGGGYVLATQLPGITNNVELKNNVTFDQAFTVGANKTLIVTGGTTDFGGQLITFKSNATGTASFGTVSGNVIGAGNVTVERFIPANARRQWRLLSVPTTSVRTIRQEWMEGDLNILRNSNNKPGFGTIISTGVAAQVIPGGFDTSTQTTSIRSYNGSSFVNMSSVTGQIATNRGYFLFVRGSRAQTINGTATDATVLRTSGALKTGDQNITASGFSLVGNPYASAIDFAQVFSNGATTGIANTLYLWDANLGTTGGYETFPGLTGYQAATGGGSWASNEVNSLVQSGQAFFVNGTGNVRIDEGDKATTVNNKGLRPSAAGARVEQLSTRLLGADGKVYDGALVVFGNSYSNAIDKLDALKLSNPGENFAISKDGSLLAVEARQSIVEEDAINFTMKNMKQQQYSLEFTASNLRSGVTAFLEDAFLGTSTAINLSSATRVSFTVGASAGSSASNRFKVVLRPSSVPVTVNGKAGIKVSPNPVESGLLNLSFSKQAQGRYDLRLLDVAGRMVYASYAVHAGGSSNHPVALPSFISRGSYHLVITAPDKTKQVQKLFINSNK
jgi:hypothetical protein